MEDTGKTTLVIANVPMALVKGMIAAAAAHNLPVVDWLKLVIWAELDRCNELCPKRQKDLSREDKGA